MYPTHHAVVASLAEEQQLRPPVLGVPHLAELLELEERVARALVAQTTHAVAPLRGHLAMLDVLVERADEHDDAEGDRAEAVELGGEHDEEAEAQPG